MVKVDGQQIANLREKRMQDLINAKDYFDVLTALKAEIKNTRLRAHLSVKRELVLLYWRIGKTILERQEKLG